MKGANNSDGHITGQAAHNFTTDNEGVIGKLDGGREANQPGCQRQMTTHNLG